MKNRCVILMSHKLTEEQIKELQDRFLIDETEYLPGELQNLWSNVPPEIDKKELILFSKKFKNWILSFVDIKTAIIQGDYGLTYEMVNFCKEKNITPIYSTTERKTIEVSMPDGSIKIRRVFKHFRFREY